MKTTFLPNEPIWGGEMGSGKDTVGSVQLSVIGGGSSCPLTFGSSDLGLRAVLAGLRLAGAVSF